MATTRMVAALKRVAALMGVVALVGACGRSVPRAERVARVPPIAGSDARADGAVPFVAESPAPATPPAVRLVVTVHRDTFFVLGRRYTSDWPAGHPTDGSRAGGQRPREPVPWPTYERGVDAIFAHPSALGLALGTTIAPESVTIRTYARVAAASGTPIGDPIATFECQRFTGPKCVFTPTNPLLGLEARGLDLGLLAGSYISVFASWHLPAVFHDRATSPPEASASWLFRGRTEGPMEASQP